MVAVQPLQFRPPGLVRVDGRSADLAVGHRPNNTLAGILTIALDYNPMWYANLYEWTADAISNGLLTGPAGKPFGTRRLLYKFPVVIRLD